MPTSVFISYSHDSSEHKDFVRSLADTLREEGLDCQIDQYIIGFPAEGWQRWMETQIEESDFVLIVCTETYLQRFRGRDPEGGRGVNFEGVVISQTLYDNYYRNTKFIPVIPEHGSMDDVPLPLKAYSTYTLMRDFTELYRVLTDQAATPPKPLGDVVELEPVPSSTESFSSWSIAVTEIRTNHPAIPNAAIDKLVASLEEQQHTLKHQNEYIDLLKEKIINLEADQEKALAENADALKEQPENPLLIAEQASLIDFDFELAAQLREKFIRQLRKDRSVQRALEDQAFARELFIGAERWESAYDLEKALSLYQEAVEIYPTYPEAWRLITLVAKKLGKTEIALDASRSLQKHIDPVKDIGWSRVALIHEGDLLKALGLGGLALEKHLEAMELSKELLEAEPENTECQRELSVSHIKIGDMHKANGDGVSALKAYEESLGIRKTLTELDPKHTEWQRDLSVSYDRVGNMHKASGDGVSALKAYEDGLAIAKKLTELDPKHTDWQRDLSVSHNKVGDMHKANGDGVSALKAYEESLAIRKKLAELDPKRTDWQRDLSVSHNKVGDMHKANGDGLSALKAYEESLAIRKKLAELDPKHTDRQRDLSVSYDRVGDMHKANGDGVSALKAYEDGLAIAKTLAELDPKHTDWQRDLSVSYARVGDIHKANGDGVSALKAYEDSLAIAKKLVELNPDIVEWQTNLVASYVKLSQVQPEKSQELLGKALAILKRLNDENRLDHEKQGWISIIENALK